MGEAKRNVSELNASEYRRALNRFVEVERKYKAEETAIAMRQKKRKLYKQRAEAFSARLRVAQRAAQVAYKERVLAQLEQEHVADLEIERKRKINRASQTTKRPQRQNTSCTSAQPSKASSVGLKNASKEARFQVILRGELQELDEQHFWVPVACELFMTSAKQCGAPVAILRYHRPRKKGLVSSGAMALFSTGRIQIDNCVFEVWPRHEGTHKRFRAPDTETRCRWTDALLVALGVAATTPQSSTAQSTEPNTTSLPRGEQRTASLSVGHARVKDVPSDVHRAFCWQLRSQRSGNLNEMHLLHQAQPNVRRGVKFSGPPSDYTTLCAPHHDSVHEPSMARKISTRVFPRRDYDEDSCGPHDDQSTEEDHGPFLCRDQSSEDSPTSRLTFESCVSPMERANSCSHKFGKDTRILPDDHMAPCTQYPCGIATPNHVPAVEQLALHAHVDSQDGLERNEVPSKEAAQRKQVFSRHFSPRFNQNAKAWCLKTARSIAGAFLLPEKR